MSTNKHGRMNSGIDVRGIVDGILRDLPANPADRAAFFAKRRQEREERGKRRIEESVRAAREAYAVRYSPEAEVAREMERRWWYDLLDFSAVAHSEVCKASQSGDSEKIKALEVRIREGLQHERTQSKAKVCGALRRALGRVEEFHGKMESARAEYLFALRHDPKAGCKWDVKRLEKALEGVIRIQRISEP
jgi:hypothetical protein